MENHEREIFNTLFLLSKFKNIECKSQNETVILTATSTSFFKKDRITIEISKKEHKVGEFVSVSVITNTNSFSGTMKKSLLYSTLLEFNILNREQFPRLITEINCENRKMVNLPDFALYIFSVELIETWPELKEDVHIKLLGERNEELVFSVKKGLNDPVFQRYLENGIKLKAAIRNCRNFKIEKLVFIDEVTIEYETLTIDELEEMELH